MVDDKFMGADDSTLCNGFVAVALGRRLRPLSLWHMWLLRSMDNPYAVGGVPQGADLCELLMVCSMTREQFAEVQGVRGQQITEMIVGRFFTSDEEDRQEAYAVVHEYLEAQTDTVEFWEDGESDPVRDRLRCPPEWHLVLCLLKNNICASESEAWNYPYARALAWRAVTSEQATGSRAYVDPLDRQQAEVLNGDNLK